MIKNFTALAVVLALAGCELPPPVVSEYNGASVKVQAYAFDTTVPTAEVNQEAERICAASKRRSEYASTMTLPNYMAEHLFLCL